MRPRGPARKPPAFAVEHLREAIAGGHVVCRVPAEGPFRPDARSYGVEVLCRLRHPAFGQLYPDVFIQLAEKNGLIAELTDAVVRQAFSDWRKWYEHGLTMRLAINVSPELLDGSAWATAFSHAVTNSESPRSTLRWKSPNRRPRRRANPPSTFSPGSS